MTKSLTHIAEPETIEDELIARCRQGDKTAFKELYEWHIKAVFNISMRILNDKDEVEDVLQESFLAAFGNLDRFKGKSAFGSWLKRIVINNSIDAARRRDRQLLSLNDVGEVVEEEEPEEDSMVYDAETIGGAIQQLPDGFRIIVTLFLFEDYSHKMIAEQLNISEGTSKSQYSRGKKKLAALIRQMNKSHAR